eukprot:TRINITY_DN2461_c0_g1_i1.p1 TRINITY_DN2461_c0_g1~~TRINITY_DN2461_c0_g1_i1.p1  ORF type:complete len:246 (-),score=49.92 TRINITY_DN2461_c0_g1_i1:432-1169(-)
MAAVTMQAALSSPALCRSSFLGSTSTLAPRSVRVGATFSPKQLKIESKGQWLPGSTSPAYLDGTLPGDNGFDPLGLGEDPENLKWFVQAELQNGRWAMLGTAGILFTELLTKVGAASLPAWYDAGEAEYFAPASTLFVIEFILFHYIEVRRWQDIKYPGSVNEDPFFKGNKLPDGEVGYPGGIFNPLGFPTSTEYKEKEIANGRLAMVSFLGYVVQSKFTNTTPLDNLLTHLSDPWHNTIVQSIQ